MRLGNLIGCAQILHIDENGKFTKVYLSSNKGTNFIQLVLMDPTSGATTLVEQDPLKRVDLEDTYFSESTHLLELTSYYDDRIRRYFTSKAMEADFSFLQKKFPG